MSLGQKEEEPKKKQNYQGICKPHWPEKDTWARSPNQEKEQITASQRPLGDKHHCNKPTPNSFCDITIRQPERKKANGHKIANSKENSLSHDHLEIPNVMFWKIHEKYRKMTCTERRQASHRQWAELRTHFCHCDPKFWPNYMTLGRHKWSRNLSFVLQKWQPMLFQRRAAVFPSVQRRVHILNADNIPG